MQKVYYQCSRFSPFPKALNVSLVKKRLRLETNPTSFARQASSWHDRPCPFLDPGSVEAD
jgi:hypothetical protein